MFEVKTEIFGTSFESVFPKPVPFVKSGIGEAGERIAETLQNWGIKATSLKLTRSDLLFGYELRVDMYGGNGSFSANAEKVSISFLNGRSHADVAAISNALAGLYKCIKLPADTTTTAVIYTHSIFESVSIRNEYLSKVTFDGSEQQLSGMITYPKVENWDGVIRFQVDKSNTYPAGIFLHWSTTFANKEITTALLEAFGSAITEISKPYQLKFTQLT